MCRRYELGVEICRTAVDEICVGVMMPSPGRIGNRGDDL